MPGAISARRLAWLSDLGPLLPLLLGLNKLLWSDNGPLRPWMVKLLLRGQLFSLSCQVVFHLVLVVDVVAAVDGICEDAVDGGRGPLTPLLGHIPQPVELLGNGTAAQPLVHIQSENFAHHQSLFRADGQLKIVNPVVAIEESRYPPLLGVEAFAKLHAAAEVGTLLLSQGPKHSEYKLRLPQAVHIGSEKAGIHPQLFERPHTLEKIHRIAGKSGDILYHHQVEGMAGGVPEQSLKLLSFPHLGAGNPLVCIDPHQLISVGPGVGLKKLLLIGQTVQLLFFGGGHPAISCNSHALLSFFLKKIKRGLPPSISSSCTAFPLRFCPTALAGHLLGCGPR